MSENLSYLDITLLGGEYRVACPPGQEDALRVLDPDEIRNGLIEAAQKGPLVLALGQRHRQFCPRIVTVGHQIVGFPGIAAAQGDGFRQIGQYRLENVRQRQTALDRLACQQQDAGFGIDRQA